MSKSPPVHELDFLKLCKNRAELSNNLKTIGISSPDLFEYAKHICTCWFQLGEEHLSEATQALRTKSTRTAFSRAYYAVYNTSKATRYVVKGIVSLKGDDHRNASTELPDDLPDVAEWSGKITALYEHRLRADYDNWSDSESGRTLTPKEAVDTAKEFVEVVRNYLTTKFGMTL
jgi:uncharacterized protein (UPF0332 family)